MLQTSSRTRTNYQPTQPDMTTPTMSIIPRQQARRLRLLEAQRIVRTHLSWAERNPGVSTPTELLGVGCLWDASSPDDSPFNGPFHRTDVRPPVRAEQVLAQAPRLSRGPNPSTDKTHAEASLVQTSFLQFSPQGFYGRFPPSSHQYRIGGGITRSIFFLLIPVGGGG